MAATKVFVTVHDDNGAPHTFEPGTEVPDWAARKISNPNVWEGDAPVFEDEDPDGDLSEDEVNEPARSGKGSGLAVWAPYAKGLGIEVPDEATRDDVIKLVDEQKTSTKA